MSYPQSISQQAFVDQLDRTGRFFYSYHFRRQGEHHAAEDFRQECLLKVFRSLHTYRGEARFSTWLYQIARNSYISERREKKISPIDPDALEHRLTHTPDPSAQLVADETHTYLLQQIDHRLTENQRRTLLAVLLLDSYVDAAQAQGISENQVRGRLHHARAKLRASLQKRERPF